MVGDGCWMGRAVVVLVLLSGLLESDWFVNASCA